MSRRTLRRWLYRGLLGLLDFVRHPVLCLRHRLTFPVIAGPGFLQFTGGVFNPGAVVAPDGTTELLAKGQVTHWLDAEGDEYMSGAPVLLSLDRGMRPRHATAVTRFAGMPADNDLRTEDFRMFRCGDDIWVNHNVINVRQNGGKTGYSVSRVGLSRLQPAVPALTFLGFPRVDFQTAKREKNWVFAEVDRQLHLFYSFYPYRVLRLIQRDTLAFSTIIDLHAPCRRAGLSDGPISYSTNPITYDEMFLLALIHQSDHCRSGRAYRHWAVLLDRTSLRPRRITAGPLFTGVGARGASRRTLYVTSVVPMDDGFVFFSGEGDSCVTYTKLGRSTLDRLWADY